MVKLLNKGIEKLKRQGVFAQADIIEQWFSAKLRPIEHLALPFDLRCAYIWGYQPMGAKV